MKQSVKMMSKKTQNREALEQDIYLYEWNEIQKLKKMPITTQTETQMIGITDENIRAFHQRWKLA